MITASLGSHRFESGPTYHYNASNVGQLTEVMFSPDQTTDYVNKLAGVNATKEEIQQVAAAGIVRLAVKSPECKLADEASKMLVSVCNGDIDQIPRDIFEDTHAYGWRDSFQISGVLSNATMDSASVLATRLNDAARTASIIETDTRTDEDLFIIGLANGGIVSAAHTFLQLGDGDHELSYVKYSRYKSDDKEPDMYPYPDVRKFWLAQSAEDRQVVIYDEDYTTGNTLKTAVDYFSNLFEKSVYGIAPVQAERRMSYKPLIIRSDQDNDTSDET